MALSAGPAALVYFQVARHSLYVRERLWAVTDYVYVFYRHSESSVFYQESALYIEGEVAFAYLHFAVRELVYEDAVTGSADEVVQRSVRAVLHIGGAHSGDRIVPEGLAAAVSCGCHVKIARADAVVKVGSEHSVRYHIGLLARNSFVVEVKASPKAGNGGVVYYVYPCTAHAASHLVGEDGLALTVEVGLEGMPHSLVQQDSARTGSHYHAHLSSRGALGLEHRVYPGGQSCGQFSYQFVAVEFRTLA